MSVADDGLREGGTPDRGVLGEVTELLPSAAYRVRLEDDSMVTAHAAAATAANFVRLRPGDKVRVELAPRDRTRGRIVKVCSW